LPHSPNFTAQKNLQRAFSGKGKKSMQGKFRLGKPALTDS
jgi:hypothetical protein